MAYSRLHRANLLIAHSAAENKLRLARASIVMAHGAAHARLYVARASIVVAYFADPTPPPSFPTQYLGLRVEHTSGTLDLCLVAAADGATGMGGIPMIDKGGTTYAIYLVDTTDPDASPVRMYTSAGVKSVRLKT